MLSRASAPCNTPLVRGESSPSAFCRVSPCGKVAPNWGLAARLAPCISYHPISRRASALARIKFWIRWQQRRSRASETGWAVDWRDGNRLPLKPPTAHAAVHAEPGVSIKGLFQIFDWRVSQGSK
jgi:hypothetical protein